MSGHLTELPGLSSSRAHPATHAHTPSRTTTTGAHPGQLSPCNRHESRRTIAHAHVPSFGFASQRSRVQISHAPLVFSGFGVSDPALIPQQDAS